jgi:hypothetical protein
MPNKQFTKGDRVTHKSHTDRRGTVCHTLNLEYIPEVVGVLWDGDVLVTNYYPEILRLTRGKAKVVGCPA